jgi:hypothetical protein
LISKLWAHGFPEIVIASYNSFLSDRTAVVLVGESDSEPFDQEVGCVQGSRSGQLLFSLLVNNIYKALQLGKIDCYDDDSYLVFKGDSWDKVFKFASTETTCVMPWLQDFGMVFNSLKTKAMHFSKHDQIEFKIQVASSEIQVGTTMSV